ncbi:MAG: hypothetical protein M1371_00895 [Actinobacteria bacterium]|nr:hypothetical protein [Actinomycetota bacterium]
MRKTDFSRVLNALYCETPDHVPLMEFTIDKKIKEQFLGRKMNSFKDEIEFWQVAGYDFIRIRPVYDFIKEYKVAKEFHNTDGRKWIQESTGVIRDRNDYKKYKWIDPTKDVNYESVLEASINLKDGMKIIGSVNGIFQNVTQIIGFEQFCYLSKSDINLIESVFKKVGEIIFEIFKSVSKIKNIGSMIFFDDVAFSNGLLVDPDILKEFLFPWIRRMIDVCRSLNMPFIFHSDGDISDILDDIVEMGVNAIHPVEPKSMDLTSLKKKYSGRLCFCGNIDVGILASGTPEIIWGEVEKLFNIMGRGGGFGVGSGNSIPDYIPIKNYRALIEASLFFS